MAKKLIEEFDMIIETPKFEQVADYDAFPNKKLLDSLRNKIIQNLIDHQIVSNNTMDEFVKREIDRSLEGYDLSSIERGYIYNMIENEISGYGPLTELLEDPQISEIMVNGINEIYIEIGRAHV